MPEPDIVFEGPVRRATEGAPREKLRYRPSSDDILRCGGCAFFAQGFCSRVAPPQVEENAVCDLFRLHEALQPDYDWTGDGAPITSVFLAKQEATRYTLGVVYEPDVPDTFGHHAAAEAIELAAWEFLANGPMAGADHIADEEGQAVGLVVESYIYRGPPWSTQAADGKTVTVRGGTWLLGVIWTPQYWARIESGEATGLSLDGIAWFDAA